jgi:Ca2+-binding EF-hand superfamily protein
MTSESSKVSRLDGMKPDDAAELVWLKLRDFAKEQGPHDVADTFKRFDTDGSGILDPKEFKAALAMVGLPGASNKVVEW